MKKIFLLLIIFVMGFTWNLNAQTKLDEGTVKAALSKIFDLSKDQNYTALASLLLYEEGKELRSYNNSVNEEKKTVKRNAKKIKAYLDLSDSYEYKSITFSKLLNNPSAELEVNFRSGDQELTISFIFVDIAGKILLADFK
jgi:hypothetical protein